MSRDARSFTVLAADVGGTKTRFGLFRAGPSGPEPLRSDTVPSDPALPFVEILPRFLDSSFPAAACFAVAGPVIGQHVAMTNHPWVLDAGELSAALAGAPTRIVNDLEATAVAMPHLPASRLVELAPGVAGAREGTRAVLAPGTGLGCASLYWDGKRHHPLASEGGHADFAPRDEREMALWRFLRDRHPHVSYERILSGPGIVTLYAFLRDAVGLPESPEVRARIAAGPDPAAVISHAGLHEGDPLGGAVLDLFASILGAKAGNLALDVLALGGVFIAGGIAPKILPKLTCGRLHQAFLDKGRQRTLLERIPLHVSLEPDAPLLGAARLACTATGTSSG
jgi:glucokinase